jgi:hypothetical protein
MDQLLEMSVLELALLYLGAGAITLGLCWIYDRIVLHLQGFYDETPLNAFGVALILVFWPIVLVLRTLAFPYQLWIAYDEYRARNGR